ncbi:MAG: hypothetical protein M1814_005223 [Vezdaea aestivalis]|nr:MAG: hypothetical protein M1814_005223 [Vezdaea aestivalis]
MSHRYGDEEMGMGKKDDDLYRTNGRAKIPNGPDIRGLFRLRRKRIIQWTVFIFIVYIFVKNLPEGQRHPSLRPTYEDPSEVKAPKSHRPSSATDRNAPLPGPGSIPPQPKMKTDEGIKHYFEGPVKFFSLSTTLHGLMRLDGHSPLNTNVLFAAASLKSVSALLPIACEMARWRRSHIHFLLAGRDPMTWDDLLAANSIEDDCRMFLHDARPDFALYSTDLRMEVSVGSMMKHVEESMHPQALIIDDSGNEEPFFTKALRRKATEMEKTLIELPENASESMMWFTRLDSGSLKAWHRAEIDIVIQAPRDSSGSLLNLLSSLQSANYQASRPPRLTIELPARTDRSTKGYLEFMKWPPMAYQHSHGYTNLLNIHHRIDSQREDSIGASIRTLELFYPAHAYDSHIIILSPQVQLSPLWFQYAKYTLLEYKYAGYRYEGSQSILGVSLTVPSMYPNCSTPFTPPALETDGTGTFDQKGKQTQFLFQAPNSQAALYFGDRWREFHSFLNLRIASESTVTRAKKVSKKEPAWVEYLLELALARGYSMIYPSWRDEGIAIIHNELAQTPEEFSDKIEKSRLKEGEEATLSKLPSILSILPKQGDLPELPLMPFVSLAGHIVGDIKEQMDATNRELLLFKEEIGACKGAPTRQKKDFEGAKDLFCIDGEIDEPKPLDPTSESSFKDSTLHTDGSRNQSSLNFPEAVQPSV